MEGSYKTKKEEGRTNKMTNFKTIAELKQTNKNNGMYFFSKDTMKFFNSKIEFKLINKNNKQYFITSERYYKDDPKLYTVRMVTDEKASIQTVSEFQEFNTIEKARQYIKELKQ